MSFFNSLNTSASGLTAQRVRMDVISHNIANVNTTRTAEGTPYKRKAVIFQEKETNSFNSYFSDAVNSIKGSGVKVAKVVEDSSEGPKLYDPNHPDADEDGYVQTPNVNIVEEMVNMISASRSYEANITALNATKSMIAKTMEITR